MFLRKASLAVAVAVLSVVGSSASAADVDLDGFEGRDGLYLSGTVGYSMPDDPDVQVEAPGDLGDTELDMDGGISGTVALGSYFSAFRVEGEVGYRLNDFEVNFPGVAPFDPDGDLETISAMVNAFYDISLNDQWSIYLGAGIGGAYTTLDVAGETDNDTVLAYQGMVGVGYAINEDVTATIGYRAFHTEDYEFDNGDVDSPWIHIGEIGLRWDLQ